LPPAQRIIIDIQRSGGDMINMECYEGLYLLAQMDIEQKCTGRV
jgi:hypothetical protein